MMLGLRLSIESAQHVNQAPDAIAITSPASNGFVWGANTAQTVSGTYHDPEGNATKVELFVTGGALLGTDNAPAAGAWSINLADCGAAGALSLTAIVTDSGGLTKSSTARTGSVVVEPTISAVSPTMGSTDGLAVVQITGTGFAAGATVTIGGVATTNVTVDSATQIRCLSPATTAGAKDVVVANLDGGSVTSAGSFTARPTLVTSGNDFTAVAWDKTNYLGTCTAHGIVEDTTTHVHHIDQFLAGMNNANPSVTTMALEVGSGTKRYAYVQYNVAQSFNLNLDTGVASSVAGVTVLSLVVGTKVYVSIIAPLTAGKTLQIYVVKTDFSLAYLGNSSSVNGYNVAAVQAA